MQPDSTVNPPSPQLPISEPELEHMMVKSFINESDTIVFNEDTTELVLDTIGLSTDENGYVIYKDTGEFAEPHAHSRELFRNEAESYWAPIKEVFYNTDEDPLDERMSDVEKVHIKDVYGITSTDKKETIVVYDNWSNILSRWEDTGVDLRLKTEWENSTEMAKMFY